MKLKSYFSGTVEAAMELARKELGEDALLVNARPATPETRHLGAYEVVFGVMPAPPQDLRPPPAGFVEGNFDEHDSYNHGRINIDASLFRPRGERFAVSPTLGRTGPESPNGRALVVLVGPPGVGKTTTLVKLAARYGLTAQRPAQILSADVYRIAAADQLQALASILGIGCQVADTPGALAQMIEEHAARDFVFVDTPGLSRADMAEAEGLIHLIANHAEADTHLVLPAFMALADMKRITREYTVFRPKKLLFTRLDETCQFEALIRMAEWSGLPISFLSTGQQIPDDLEPASRARLTRLVAESVPHEESSGIEEESSEIEERSSGIELYRSRRATA